MNTSLVSVTVKDRGENTLKKALMQSNLKLSLADEVQASYLRTQRWQHGSHLNSQLSTINAFKKYFALYMICIGQNKWKYI